MPTCLRPWHPAPGRAERGSDAAGQGGRRLGVLILPLWETGQIIPAPEFSSMQWECDVALADPDCDVTAHLVNRHRSVNKQSWAPA